MEYKEIKIAAFFVFFFLGSEFYKWDVRYIGLIYDVTFDCNGRTGRYVL